MVGEAAVKIVSDEVTETVAKRAKELLKGMPNILEYWRKAKHPSLDQVREICDLLETFLIDPTTPLGSVRYQFPKAGEAGRAFTFRLLSPSDVAELWFRTDTKLWKERIAPITNKWIHLAPPAGPYFRGRPGSELDYAHSSISRADRHPIFRNVHPFIMTCPIARDLLSSDPVGELLDYFVDAWNVFVDDEYTLFRDFNVLRVSNQAYAEGVFTITDKAGFWSKSVRHENVQLWRCIMITAYANNVEFTNIGVPLWRPRGETDITGETDLKNVSKWMMGFRVLRDYASAQ
jgi:hypothetical protein